MESIKLMSSIPDRALCRGLIIQRGLFSAHYRDVISNAMASQITSIPTVCSAGCSGANQTKHQNSTLLAFVGEIRRRPVVSPHKRAVIWWRHHGRIVCKFLVYTTAPRSCLVARATKISNPLEQSPSWETCYVIKCRINGLLRFIKYSLLFVTYIQISACFGNKVVQHMCTGRTLALCLGFPNPHTWVSWQQQFKLDLILLGTMSCGQW